MNWFLCTLVCLLAWGTADLFYKKSTDEADRYSHLKISVWVGMVMGACSIALLLIPGTDTCLSDGFSVKQLFSSAVHYLPASAGYILSMVIGYAGIRYLEMSVISPVQNASGAFSVIGMLIWFTIKGNIAAFTEEFSLLDILGTVIIVAGMIALAVVEQKGSAAGTALQQEKSSKRYHVGAAALLFPLLYCLFDAIGTAADGILLSEQSTLQLSETQVLCVYGLTFFLFGACAWLYMLIKTKKPYLPFRKDEKDKALAAICEEFGQVFYIFAMAAKPLLAAPAIAGYCTVSVLLCRLFLKEKLGRARYLCIAAVILGILMLGISEGMAE